MHFHGGLGVGVRGENPHMGSEVVRSVSCDDASS